MASRCSKSIFRVVALGALLAAGCGGGASVESFHPAKDLARDALTTALEAWQGGREKPGVIEETDPEVSISDGTWASGGKLKSYEIVEDLPGDAPRKFSVKLTLEGEAAPKDVIYVVVGKNPLWVMPEDEYNRSGGM